MTTEVRLDECPRAFEEEVGKLGRTETQKGGGDWMPIRAREMEAQVCDESLCWPSSSPVPPKAALSSTTRPGHSSSASAVLPREESRGNGGVGRGVSPRVTDESETGWDSTRDSGGQGRRQTPKVGSASRLVHRSRSPWRLDVYGYCVLNGPALLVWLRGEAGRPARCSGGQAG